MNSLTTIYNIVHLKIEQDGDDVVITQTTDTGDTSVLRIVGPKETRIIKNNQGGYVPVSEGGEPRQPPRSK